MKRIIGLILPRDIPSNFAVAAFAQQFARKTNIAFDFLVVDTESTELGAKKWLHYGAERVYLASVPKESHPSPRNVAEICTMVLAQADEISLAGPATQFGTDTLSSVAGMLGLPMLSSVCEIAEIDGQHTFQVVHDRRRQSIRVDADQAIFSISQTAFGKPETTRKASPVIPVPIGPSSQNVGITWEESLPAPNRSLQLADARIVVAGGRAFGDARTFNKLIGGLAEKLGGAAGATGAAVQAGIAPKELLVGQTGQTVSPDLYIAAGISGSDQHTGGMHDPCVIVAINSNPNATIFRMADYGLVADVHQALPELIEKL